jgi:hypothetical protein
MRHTKTLLVTAVGILSLAVVFAMAQDINRPPGLGVNEKDKYGKTALMRAAEHGDLKDIRTLIAAGADVNAKDDTGETALMAVTEAAWSSPDNDFLLACVNALIAAGADPSAKDNAGETALTRFIEHDHLHCVKILIIAGANVNEVTQPIVDGDAPPLSQYELKEIGALRSDVGRAAKLKHVENAGVLVHVEKMSRIYEAPAGGRYIYSGHRITFIIGWKGGAVTDIFDTYFQNSIAIDPGTKSGYMSNVPSGFIPPRIDTKPILRQFVAASGN